MAVLEESIDVQVPMCTVFTHGPTLAQLLEALSASSHSRAARGTLRLDVAHRVATIACNGAPRAQVAAPGLRIGWSGWPDCGVTFTPCGADETRVCASISWPGSALAEPRARRAKARLRVALLRFQAALDLPALTTTAAAI